MEPATSDRKEDAESARIFEKLELIERRLFRDNGTISIQTRLDRHEQVIRGVLWALSVIGGAFLTTLVAVSVLAIKAWMQMG